MTETVFDVFALLIDLLEVGAFALSLPPSFSLCFLFFFKDKTGRTMESINSLKTDHITYYVKPYCDTSHPSVNVATQTHH